MRDAPTKPLPEPNADTAPFWEGCARGELWLQRCRSCRAAQFPPRALCATCQAPGPAWEQASGRGRIASHTRVHRPPSAAFRADAPYVIALVDLDEGPRIMLTLRGRAAEAPRIGARVRLGFDPPAGPQGIALPHAAIWEES
jgi:uncharacterized OB-fold protein